MKPELIPTILYGEGRPRDVGTDRALANNLNVLHDYTTAHQMPYLYPLQIMGVFSEWRLLFFGPIFLGTDNSSATVKRTLRVAPWLHSGSAGVSTSCRITLTDQFPTLTPSVTGGNAAAVRFSGKYSQATWSASTTTPAIQNEVALDLVKDLTYGIAWLAFEVSNSNARSRGIATCVEGVRVTQ